MTIWEDLCEIQKHVYIPPVCLLANGLSPSAPLFRSTTSPLLKKAKFSAASQKNPDTWLTVKQIKPCWCHQEWQPGGGGITEESLGDITRWEQSNWKVIRHQSHRSQKSTRSASHITLGYLSFRKPQRSPSQIAEPFRVNRCLPWGRDLQQQPHYPALLFGIAKWPIVWSWQWLRVLSSGRARSEQKKPPPPPPFQTKQPT